MKNSTYSVLSRIVSTVKKSQATIPAAWALRNCVHVGPERRGAGPKPCRRSNVLIVLAAPTLPVAAVVRAAPPTGMAATTDEEQPAAPRALAAAHRTQVVTGLQQVHGREGEQ